MIHRKIVKEAKEREEKKRELNPMLTELSPTLADAVALLNFFPENPEASRTARAFNFLELPNSSVNIDEIRKTLNAILSDKNSENIWTRDVNLADAAYVSLIALAIYHPHNDTDFATLDSIEEENSIFTSTGHQFDIRSLLTHHHDRDYKGSTLGEVSASKTCI